MVTIDYVFRGDRGNYQEEDSLYFVNKYVRSKLGGECAVRMYDKSRTRWIYREEDVEDR